MKSIRDYQGWAINGNEQCPGILAALRQYKSTLLVMATGLGKAQPLDSMVLTTTGWVQMGLLAFGDLVIGSDGRGHAITAIHPQGPKDIYRVTFSDRTSAECCKEHLWNLQTKSQKCRDGGFSNMELQWLMGDLKDGSGASKWFLPLVAPVEFDHRDVPIDPYVLGALLGDGGLTHYLGMTSADPFIIEEIGKRLPDAEMRSLPNFQYRIAVGNHGPKGSPLRRALKSLGIWGKKSPEKFIPELYIFNDIDTRLSVLRGLMDTDGHVTSADRHSEFNTTSLRLANDVCELVRSLGGCTRVRTKAAAKYTHKGEKRVGRVSFRVTVSLKGINPFLLPRKAEMVNLHQNQGQTKAITSVKLIGQTDCQCITIDAEDGLYVTNDYVLTHNSFVLAKIAEGWTHGNVLCLAHRIELVDQLADTFAVELGYRPSVEQGPRGLDPDTLFGAGHVVVGSIQSMITEHRLRKFKDHPFGLIIVDEAHRAVSPSYTKLFDRYREVDPECRLLGCTATPNRTDGTAMGLAFQSVAFDMGIIEGIAQGWLVDIHQKFAVVEDLDLSKIACTRNQFGEMDYKPSDLEALLTQEGPLHAMSRPVLDCTANGEQAIIFTASVPHAHLWERVLNHYRPGCAAAIDGTMDSRPGGQRAEIVRKYKAGDLQFLLNYGVTVEGFDAPRTAFVVMGRPTKSVLVKMQMIGRCTRALSGVVDGFTTPEERKDAIAASAKPFATVLDFVGNLKGNEALSCSDILGGNYDVDIRAGADEIIGSKGGNVLDALRKAKASLLLEAEEIKRRPLRDIVQELEIGYHLGDIGAFDGRGGGRKATTSRGGATDSQVAALVNLGVPQEEALGYSKKQAGVVMVELQKKRCTTKQAKTLAGFGIDPSSFNVKTASEQIQQIADKGWRWP